MEKDGCVQEIVWFFFLLEGSGYSKVVEIQFIVSVFWGALNAKRSYFFLLNFLDSKDWLRIFKLCMGKGDYHGQGLIICNTSFSDQIDTSTGSLFGLVLM